MFTFDTKGFFKEGSWNLEVLAISGSKSKVIFIDTDTSKFRYEKGYQKRVERKLSKDGKTFKYQNITFDISCVL